MVEQIELERVAKPPAEADSAKRQQIIEGARTVFLAQGFDAASMNDIARTAGVSKGTLYVYFENKEQLFQAICSHECEQQAETLFKVHPEDKDVETTLTRVGVEVVTMLCRPEKASSCESGDRHRRTHARDRQGLLRNRPRPWDRAHGQLS